ncbi:DM13 domain-containing protein [Pelobium sp.]|nr:DM13 domain-containing protein [Pelobium sp.]MDA9555660.1 DM13 domain-containing protein [Pelobium sp.]
MQKYIRFQIVLGFIALILSSCNGTDVLDDPLVEPIFKLNKSQAILRINEETVVTAKYYDEYGVEKIVPITWSTTQPQIVSVNQNGKITALKAGSAQVYPKYQDYIGPAVEVNVVATDNSVAKVTISASKSNLNLAEQIPLTISAQNINGVAIKGSKTEWFSENNSILQVDSNGLVTALANGVAGIHAKIDGVKSNSIDFSVGVNTTLTGNFVSAGGYKAVGTATLKNLNNQIILELGSNFETSFALGTFVYLANSTNGATVRASGLDLGEIKSNGAKTFNVSQIKPNLTLTDYKYVVILCKPASVSFGFAELK